MSAPTTTTTTAHTTKKKSWREIHQERKQQRKVYREQNLLKKLEKQKKRDELQRVKDDEVAKEKQIPTVSTMSIAVAGSILENAQSKELQTYLAGQIARAACIFQCDEIIVYDDLGIDNGNVKRIRNDQRFSTENDGGDGDERSVRYCCIQLARILQYAECPQYLRKSFFPMHKDLKFSGLLNPLDAPHHLRQQNDFIFREGVVSGKPPKLNKGSYVSIGLLNDCLVNEILRPGLRVTVKLQPDQDLKSKKIRGEIVSPQQPRRETGVYWGYTVRIAKSFSEIFSKAPYEDGYDLTIGTSDKGQHLHTIESKSLQYNHALIVFGGVKGIEAALENDNQLNADDPSLLFDKYLNVAPNQGSRTIRTEEAILISLAALDDKMKPEHPPKEFDLAHSIPQSEDTGLKQNADGPSKRKQQKKWEKHHESLEQPNDSANESIEYEN